MYSFKTGLHTLQTRRCYNYIIQFFRLTCILAVKRCGNFAANSLQCSSKLEF